MTRSVVGSVLRALVHGLQIDAQCGMGGVVHLVVRAQQQHEGMLGRLRQHLANALFRAGDLCHPGDHHGGIRVVELQMPGAAVDDDLAHRADAHPRQIWPIHGADGEAHYHALVVHEGVKRYHDGRPALHQLFRLRRQRRADDAHDLLPLNQATFAGRTVQVWPDAGSAANAQEAGR